MIKAIIFDCFGVLYQSSIEHLVSLTPDEHKQELVDASHASDLGYLSYAEYYDRVAELTGKTAREAEDIVRARHLRNTEVIEAARSLHERYKTAMLSNVGARIMDDLFSADELRELFDAVVLSSNVGMVKPYPEIFEYAAAQLELHPSECVMVDDRVENVEGAVATGMSGIVFTTLEQFEIDLDHVLRKEPV